ncbi:MAG: KamA family protein [Candidatus Aminicenantes bacterium]|nr:KamA family protein [Candidatus Aminicenantes bacterium]NIM79405.1 KamA family protein [Candidatus Aminicenantes bacterium]NIN18687.1 KamA family protein [Candidatus Aminicenantes bacterium]NIN42584.1 KamA family protein [Candidatus Aminicenantes bacterium]NIN85350.1 KamA family protein [Candidatus Aminicenantes bacterium]
MQKDDVLDKVAITVKSHKLLKKLLKENPKLDEIMRNSRNETEALVGVRNWVMQELEASPAALTYYKNQHTGRVDFEALKWRDYAAIRILDYIDHAGMEFVDLNLRGEVAISNPIKTIWMAVTHGTGGAKPYFFEDMLHLFRQFRGEEEPKPPIREKVEEWMSRYVSGQDPRIVRLREENRERILEIIIKKIDSGKIKDAKFKFEPGMSHEQKFLRVLEWWNDWKFHLKFAVRNPDDLNEMLGHSLDPDTMKILYDAQRAGIPFFVNPYYLSLLHVRVPYFAIGADLAVRYYVVYSQQLVDEFGHIVAWEKEDVVEPGKPNAAGWLLPSQYNVHRRYPEVAILIPDTMGRSCGGLCAPCQRMYEFQRGNLNFNLDKLKPGETWSQKLARLMEYFEKDAQLRDILVTGGDALMSSDKSMEQVLEAIYQMALRKREANKKRKEGEKYAELVRVRLGTRLLAYLPQRVTPELTRILADFKKKASKIGVKQFVIQTHFESPMEVTPKVKEAVGRLISAGWTMTNQCVFTTAASRRGHTAKLRQVLNEVGILPYYTFTVKGYMENWFNFTPNARAMQEQLEEKIFGQIPGKHHETIKNFPLEAETMVENIEDMRRKENLPFLATDRNVLNLPSVGKSLTCRVIGITRYGRRILEFDHDGTRRHSPIINKMGKVVIVESKSISEYLRQLEEIGEDISEYQGVWGYSLGETEPRMPIYEYPSYDFKTTEEFTNLEIN